MKEAKESGYLQNAKMFDGIGWTPSKNLHSDNVRTEYRIRFCTEKKFQGASWYPRQGGKTQYDWK